MQFIGDQRLDLALEPLEKRAMLAGNVTARLTNAGDLLIHGDHAANAVYVGQSSLGFVTVSGAEGTTVNGAASYMPYGRITDDLRISLKGGDDHVLLQGLTVPDELHFHGSHGDDQLGVLSGSFGKITVLMGSGDDKVGLVPDTVAGRVKVIGAHGNDQMGMSTSSGAVTINLGHGDDDVLITGTSMASAHISTGAGADDIYVSNSYVDGHLKVFGGGGDDKTAFLGSSSVGGHAIVHVGGGFDRTHEQNLAVQGLKKFISAEATTIPNTSGLFFNLAAELNQVFSLP